jgi:hypothetical protein
MNRPLDRPRQPQASPAFLRWARIKNARYARDRRELTGVKQATTLRA